MLRQDLTKESERQDRKRLHSQRRVRAAREGRNRDIRSRSYRTSSPQHAAALGNLRDRRGQVGGAPGGLAPPPAWLDEAVVLIESRATYAELAFLDRQAAAYKSIFQDAFALTCGCKSQLPAAELPTNVKRLEG